MHPPASYLMPKRAVAAIGPHSLKTVIPMIETSSRGGCSGRYVAFVAGTSGFYDPQKALVREIRRQVEWDSQHGEARSLDPDAVAAICAPTVGTPGREKTNAIPGKFKFFRAMFKFLKSVIGEERYVRVWTRKGGGLLVMMKDRVLFVNAFEGGHWKCVRVPEEGLG